MNTFDYHWKVPELKNMVHWEEYDLSVNKDSLHIQKKHTDDETLLFKDISKVQIYRSNKNRIVMLLYYNKKKLMLTNQYIKDYTKLIDKTDSFNQFIIKLHLCLLNRNEHIEYASGNRRGYLLHKYGFLFLKILLPIMWIASIMLFIKKTNPGGLFISVSMTLALFMPLSRPTSSAPYHPEDVAQKGLTALDL